MKKKVRKYHKGGSHEDHHASRVERAPTPTPIPLSSRKEFRERVGRLPRELSAPRPTRTTDQPVSAPRPTQPIMQPTQTGQVSATQRQMMEYAREQAKQQVKAQEELRKENEAYRKRIMQGGDRRIKRGSKLDESMRNVRGQQLASYARGRENRDLTNVQDLERDRVERIRLQNEAERIRGTGRRMNPNAGRRRVRRRR